VVVQGGGGGGHGVVVHGGGGGGQGVGVQGGGSSLGGWARASRQPAIAAKPNVISSKWSTEKAQKKKKHSLKFPMEGYGPELPTNSHVAFDDVLATAVSTSLLENECSLLQSGLFLYRSAGVTLSWPRTRKALEIV